MQCQSLAPQHQNSKQKRNRCHEANACNDSEVVRYRHKIDCKRNQGDRYAHDRQEACFAMMPVVDLGLQFGAKVGGAWQPFPAPPIHQSGIGGISMCAYPFHVLGWQLAG